jgi:SulP family sulfate permease
MVVALFGSSRQLATGPVAVVSLMTAAALAPLVAGDPQAYVAYSVVLALMVGLFQLGSGLLRLGILVDFLSHPVVVGFMNAGALIIATSKIGKLFGVSVSGFEHHYETVW